MNRNLTIVAVIMCLIALAGGIWGWWIENGGSSEDSNQNEKESVIETDETERIKEDEKN